MILTLIKKIKILPVALLIISAFYGCNIKDPSISMKTNTSIPKLLDRNENLRMGKEWDDVQTQYQKLKLAITKKADDYESKIKMAQLFIREARVTGEHGHYYNAALTMTDQILVAKPTDANFTFLALLTKGGVQLSHHDFKGALATGNQALALNPNNPQIYGVLVDANVELGNYQDAVALADRMMALKPDLRSYARISYLREIHGEVPEAMKAMEMAISSGIPGYEDTAWAMLTYAELNEMYNKNKEAKMLYEEILAQRPNYPFAVAGLGKIELKNKNYPKAIKLTNEAIKTIPEVGFYTQLLEIYKATGDKSAFDKTLKDVWAMLADDEKSGHNMRLEYADIYLNLLDNPTKALDYAQQEYNVRPKNIDVNRMMANIYKKLNDDQKYNQHLAVAKSTHSKHPELAVAN
jgi:tetratricopeptide (TPR) repeat protein